AKATRPQDRAAVRERRRRGARGPAEQIEQIEQIDQLDQLDHPEPDGAAVPRIAPLIALALSAAVMDAAAQAPDTIFAEVGHPSIDGRLMRPHAARVRIYRGDTLVSQWLNELTLGDSAGRAIMRWVTTGEPVPAFPDRVISVLRQTYDARTLAPMGYWTTASTGASVRVAIDGRSVKGFRRTATDTTRIPIDAPVPRLGFFAGASDLVPIAAGLKHGTVMVAPVWSPGNPAHTEDRVFTVI